MENVSERKKNAWDYMATKTKKYTGECRGELHVQTNKPIRNARQMQFATCTVKTLGNATSIVWRDAEKKCVRTGNA